MYKIQRNRWVCLWKKTITKLFKNISKGGIVTIKKICGTVKSFLTN